MPRSKMSKPRTKEVNPHKILGQIAKAEDSFQTRRYKLAERDSSNGNVIYDKKKLDALIGSFAEERDKLIGDWENHHTPLLFFRHRPCCCCCCCEDGSEGESWVKNLEYNNYIVFDEFGVTVDLHPDDVKRAHGSAGDAQLSGPAARPMSRISFGFRTQFDLPYDFNELSIRSGVNVDLGWLETQSSSIYASSQINVLHQIHVSSGAFNTSRMANIFTQTAAPLTGSGGFSGEVRDSELIIEFERSGLGSLIVVDEAIIIEARRIGDPEMTSAVCSLWSQYEPLHVAIKMGS